MSCHSREKIFGLLYAPAEYEVKLPAVILSHGYNSSHRELLDMAECLAKRGFAAYCYDFCGGSAVSESGGSSLDMSIETEIADLKAVIKAISENDFIDIDRIYLYGESQGGFVAALTAAEMPERIAAMILLYPAFCIPDQWLSKDPESMAKPFAFMGDMLLSKKFYDDVPRYDIYDRVSRYNNPVMIFHGDSDELVALSYSERLKTTFPNAKLKVIKGAGHGFYGDDREYVKRAAVDFFTTL